MQAIAAHIGSTDPALVDVVDPPSPRGGEVLCRTLQLGVCGTDREVLSSRHPYVPEGSDYLILGHECLAQVAQVGAGVDDFHAGDLVVPVVRRARTELTRRIDLLPFGHYTERGIVFEHGFSSNYWLDRPEHLFRVDEAVQSVAVFTEPLSVAEKAVNEALAVQRGRLGASVWDDSPPRVLVSGMGPIGFAAVLACYCRDWPVTMYGRDGVDSFRAELTSSLGATYVSDEQCDLNPKNVEAHGFDLILECTGSDEVMLRAANSLASCGVMVWVGASRVPQPQSHNVSLMMRTGIIRNHVHIGTVNSAPRDFRQALDHLMKVYQQHPNLLESMITDQIAPADSLWHYRHRKPQGIKTVLMFE